MRKEKLKLMCLCGIFTAVVFVFTAYLHIPSHTGYTHVGDGFIYLAACILPLRYAVFVGSIGALFADCLTGFPMWAPGSVVIKGVAVLFFSCRSKHIITLRNTLALIPASLLCICGYYLYEVLLTRNFIGPLSGMPGYITQSVMSSVLFIALGMALDKIRIKERI